MQFGSKTFYTRNTYPGGVKMWIVGKCLFVLQDYFLALVAIFCLAGKTENVRVLARKFVRRSMFPLRNATAQMCSTARPGVTNVVARTGRVGRLRACSKNNISMINVFTLTNINTKIIESKLS